MSNSASARRVIFWGKYRWLVAGFAVVAGLAVSAPVAAGASAQPQGSAGGSGVTGPRIGWAACGPRLECAGVPVPLDWHHPRGPAITLAVIRHLASHPGQRIGSLFLNPGGPGDSGVDAAADQGEALDAITGGRFDVIGWDLRGTHRSSQVSCFAGSRERAVFWHGMPVPTKRQAEKRYLAKTVAMARHCGARNGELLAHISTADTVRDLDYLRQLVGDRRLSYLGESVGTFIGQTYANMFPDRVRAMALDGVIDPVAYTSGTAAALASGLPSVDSEFGQFLALCDQAGPAACALAGEGPAAERVHKLLARLRHHPIPAPSATPPGWFSYGEALTLLKFAALPAPALWPATAAMLAEAERGDASALEDLANGYAAEPARRQFETNTVLLCPDSPARQGSRAWPRVVHRLEAVSRLGGAPMGWMIGAPCASWPARSANRYTGPWHATTQNPILLIGTRFDPNTPLANARLAERRLGNAVLLTHDGYGHTSHADPSRCVTQALGRYLIDITPPVRGTVCPSDHLPFDPSFGLPLP
jgi:pimeloyl-ACP methyl ester carboxylesterase